MNKLTKVGCSALCGSLAAISAANAGDLTATGSAHMTFMSMGDDTTGNPVGMQSNVTFNGSGELDNGWTFGLSIANKDGNAFSASNIEIGMGGLGSLNFDGGDSSNGIAAYDNVMPTAWEEAHGAGLSGGVRTVVGSGASNNVQYTTPTVLGTTLKVTYAHDYGTTDTTDKSTGTTEDKYGRSYDATIKVNPSMGTEILSGLNLYAGGSVIEVYDNEITSGEDAYQAVGAITYALGPVEIGWMVSGEYDGDEGMVASGAATAKYHTYKNSAFGIAFNVNDDFSVSYGMYDSRKAGYTTSDLQSGPETRIVEVVSWQAAYTMGGASVRLADVQVDNASWSAGADRSATIVSLGLAF